MKLRRATVAAPCKVNLTLDVFPPTVDGFHPLDSLVVTFSLADTVIVEAVSNAGAVSIRLLCDDSTLPTDDNNLAYRAARVFAERFPESVADSALTIHLAKRLPHQAGLGGGSSDAAAVLRALAALYLMSSGDLNELAARIGSDVPLFLAASPAVRMRGRGERIDPLPRRLSPLYGVIVRPDAGVATGPAYALLDGVEWRVPGGSTERLLAQFTELRVLDAVSLGPLLHNDFEVAVLPAFPAVRAAHKAVTEAGALRALLSGSGSAIFGLAQDEAHASALAAALREHFPFVEVAVNLGAVPEVALTEGWEN